MCPSGSHREKEKHNLPSWSLHLVRQPSNKQVENISPEDDFKGENNWADQEWMWMGRLPGGGDNYTETQWSGGSQSRADLGEGHSRQRGRPVRPVRVQEPSAHLFPAYSVETLL